MNKLEELNEKILKIKMAIQENYPELSHEIPDLPEANNEKDRGDYFDLLVEQFRDYITDHQLSNSNRKYKDHHL